MSLGQPDLYIGSELMQTAKDDPRPALAGLRIGWGTESRLEFDPASTLSGQLLIKGAVPSFIDLGAPVGLVDPISARTLFAGTLGPCKAVPDESVKGATRVSFTAASPLAELVKHTVLDFDWPFDETAAARFGRLAAAMPRGWQLSGSTGDTWLNQGRQRYQSEPWIALAERFCHSYMYRYHDTSSYVPGAGLTRRISLTPRREKTIPAQTLTPGEGGIWHTGAERPGNSTGLAVLPESAVNLDIEWEKTPDDIVTDVQISTEGGATADPESDSFEFLMSAYVNYDALQDAYGFRQAKIDTALGPGAVNTQIVNLANYWIDTATKWRPTALQLPDSRRLDASPLLNLIAASSRHMAAVSVPTTAQVPGLIRSFVMAGQATWTGKKWITDLTLGRTL